MQTKTMPMPVCSIFNCLIAQPSMEEDMGVCCIIMFDRKYVKKGLDCYWFQQIDAEIKLFRFCNENSLNA